MTTTICPRVGQEVSFTDIKHIAVPMPVSMTTIVRNSYKLLVVVAVCIEGARKLKYCYASRATKTKTCSTTFVG